MWLSANEARYYQRGPGYSLRIQTQWRQVDTEHKEACEVRRQWMQICGVPADEIESHLASKFELKLEQELAQLLSIIDLKSSTPRPPVPSESE